MFKLVVVLCFAAACQAAAIEAEKEVIPIVAQESEVDGESGKFHYSYESGDGTKAAQDGVLKTIDEEHAGESVSGSVSYTDPEGRSISLTYTADENGYQPHGDHLPVAPEIPPAIQRALAYLATAPPPEEEKKGKKSE